MLVQGNKQRTGRTGEGEKRERKNPALIAQGDKQPQGEREEEGQKEEKRRTPRGALLAPEVPLAM